MSSGRNAAPTVKSGPVQLWTALLDTAPAEWVPMASLSSGAGRSTVSVAIARWESRGWVERCRVSRNGKSSVDVRLTSSGRVWVREWLAEIHAEATTPTPAEIRTWAASLGLPDSRGRIPRLLADRWNREHPERPYPVKECR